ncbi:MAG: hypothetical protein M3461_06155 [Pseudomonadota bacterium]|nr:hypothetical protein [Pseudomonadota bacterium]
MIFEIALGVFLGIVLAVLTLKHWKQLVANLQSLIAGSFVVFRGLVVFGLLILVGVLVWLNLETIAVFAGALAAVALIYGVPFWAYTRVSTKYPTFGLLLKGEPPWDRPVRLPLRLVVMGVFAVAVAGLGIGALMASLSLVDCFHALINTKADAVKRHRPWDQVLGGRGSKRR